MTDSGSLEKLLTKLIEISEESAQQNKLVKEELQRQSNQLEQIRYSAALEMQTEIYHKITSNQLSFMETVELVAEKRMSIARFGDGELGLAAHEGRNIRFQRGSYELARRLREVISTPQDGLLVALPPTVVDPFWMTSLARYWGILRNVVPNDRRWGVSTVTRAGAFKAEGDKLTQAWRKCWDGRSITVVTGKGSRFEPLPELFSNAASIEVVDSEPKHAFEEMPALLERLNARKLDLVLIALGPAGTVLAADLHDQGVQALDVGHLPNSYNEAFHDAPKPESLPFSRVR